MHCIHDDLHTHTHTHAYANELVRQTGHGHQQSWVSPYREPLVPFSFNDLLLSSGRNTETVHGRPDHKEALTTWPSEHLHGIRQGMPSPEDPVVGAGHNTDDIAVHLVYSDFGWM